jgi:asparagine synthase (glutamine-hydrolysing)
VCQREGIDLAYTTATPADFIANQTRDITTQPTHTLRYEMRVSRLAAERGIRVMLSGWGGDEFATFNGRGYMASLFLSGRWISLLRELNLRRVIRRSPLHVTTLRRVVAPLLPNSVLPWLSWRTIRWLYITYAPPQPLPNCLHAAFAARLHQASPLPRTHTREVPGVRTNQIELLQLGHLAARMESWADNGAEHGVDYRYPLLDQRVIEFCLSIPDHLFFRHGWHRYLFREACQGILPERVRWIRNKRDPAVVAQASSVVPQSKDLLIAALRERQNSIQHAQMVDAGCLINGLSQQPDQPDMQMSHAWRALWLAFVSPEAHL